MNLPNVEVVAAEVHKAWMASKERQGVTSRKAEDGEELMVPYEVLSEKAKDLDRYSVIAVFDAIKSLAGGNSGVDRIAAERQRQIEDEGFDATHDDEHDQGELALAACYYAFPETRVIEGYGVKLEVTPDFFFPEGWSQAWAGKGNDNRIQQLIKAGALIAAEVDRLVRAGA